jgi:hypothetical protein
MTRPNVLPSAICTASAPRIGIFRGSMAGLCAPLSTLRRNPRGPLRMTRGRCGSLLLHRKRLALSTPCRSPGASQMFSALPLKPDIAEYGRHVRLVPIVLQKSFLAGDGNFLEPLMRFARGDVTVHIGSHKNDHGPPYPSYRALQRRRRLKIDFREIFGVARFSTFATLSANSRHRAALHLMFCQLPRGGRCRSKLSGQA